MGNGLIRERSIRTAQKSLNPQAASASHNFKSEQVIELDEVPSLLQGQGEGH